MKLRWILIAFFATSLSVFAQAETQEGGSWSSGGGSAVACFTDRAVAAQVQEQRGMVTNDQLAYIEFIEVLDLFEWKRPRGIDGRKNLALAEPRPGEDYVGFAKRISDRAYNTLAIHSPTRESSLGNVMWHMGGFMNKNDHSGWQSERIIWTGTSLVNLQDEGTPMRFGGNCALVPMAVQQGLAYGLRLFIDDRLFFHPKHSVQSQAALFVHEFTYSFARELGHPNSSATRQAVGWLMQNDAETGVADILSKIEGMGFLSKFEGLRKIHSYGRMKLASGLAYSSLRKLDAAKTIWADRGFRAMPGAREERELLAEAAAFLAEHGVSWNQGTELNANRAFAYLRSYPEKAALSAELDAVINGKADLIAASFAELIKKPEDLGLQHVPGLTDKNRAEIVEGMKGVFQNRVLPLVRATLTDEELAAAYARRREAWDYPYPVFTFDELIKPGARDNQYTDVFYWFSDSIPREFNDKLKDFSFYELKMPVL